MLLANYLFDIIKLLNFITKDKSNLHIIVVFCVNVSVHFVACCLAVSCLAVSCLAVSCLYISVLLYSSCSLFPV